jgi:hypothetical protein
MIAEFICEHSKLLIRILFKEWELELEMPCEEFFLIRGSLVLLFLSDFLDYKSAMLFLLHIKISLVIDSIFDVFIELLVLELTLKSLI